MKLIKAIVRPNKVDDVKDALGKLNISGMTVTEVRGHGKQKGHTAIYRGKEYNVSLLPKMEIETVVSDDVVDEVVKAIIGAARTGEIGDGRLLGGREMRFLRKAGLPREPARQYRTAVPAVEESFCLQCAHVPPMEPDLAPHAAA